MSRLNIVHVIESASGGSLEYVRGVCKATKELGWNVTVVYSRRPDTPKTLTEMFPSNVDLCELPMQRQINPLTDMAAVLALRHVLNKLRPDIVHLHSSKAGAVGRLASRSLGHRVIYTPHGYAFFRRDISRTRRCAYWCIEKLLAVFCKCSFLVCSNLEYNETKKFSGEDRIHLIYNSVDVPASAPSTPSSTGRDKVVTTGRISTAKDPGLFVEIARRLKSSATCAQFTWVGDGELRSDLEAKAKKEGLKLFVTGWLPKTEVLRTVSEAQVYIQTSSWESMPLSLLEAMSLARPIVVSDIQAHRDIIRHGESGFLAQNADEFVYYVERFLSDRELSRQMGIRAWRQVNEQHSASKFEQKIIDLYQKLAR